MREIKFRAWDKYDKKLIDWVDLIENWGFSSIYGNDGFILMQYTELKDKNGVEIFEGDIVYRVKDRFGKGKHEYWSVEYDESDARFVVYNQLNSIRDLETDITRGNDNPFFTTYGERECELEVIGNIYENPELLTPVQYGKE